MLWFPISLVAAFTLATTDAMLKGFLKEMPPWEMAIARTLFTVPWLVLSLFFIPLVMPDSTYFIVIALAAPFEILALYCYMKAIKTSPLSLTVPFLAFTPAFVILSGRIVLGESLNIKGIAGVLLIVSGSYFMNISSIRNGLLSPIKAVFRERGSRLMLLASFLYSITAVLGKTGILHSNPYFFASSYFIYLALLMTIITPMLPGVSLKSLTAIPLKGMAIGAVNAVMLFSHMIAISMVEAAYMVSVKRTSLLFGILYGAWLFKEKGTGERMLGSVIMLAGVVLIGFSS